MSKVIAICGESGTGKTTSMRNLKPEETYYIDADRKGLSWKGWREQYNTKKKNYFCSADINVINEVLAGIDKKRPEIKTIIIDTINGIMISDEMKRSKEKGYDKWADLAQCVWDIVDGAYDYREDLTIVFVAHTQTERDDSGFMFTRIKTSGKYVFETQAKNSTAKSPMGAFESFEIENDIVKVIDALKEY